MKIHLSLVIASLTSIATSVFAENSAVREGSVRIDMKRLSLDGVGSTLGYIDLKDTSSGLEINLALTGLPPGLRGFHVHQNPSCDAGEKDGIKGAGLAAGGHYDPHATNQHKGPSGGGHVGDLPRLPVLADGRAAGQLLVPNLKLSAIRGKSLMIHGGGDNYSDAPLPLGGGGPRIACGIIP